MNKQKWQQMPKHHIDLYGCVVRAKVINRLADIVHTQKPAKMKKKNVWKFVCTCCVHSLHTKKYTYIIHSYAVVTTKHFT